MIRTIAISLLALAAGAWAQGPPPGAHGMGMGGRFLGAEAGRAGRVVTGAPYTADVVTESTQTLADGSHIRQSTTSHVSRDSEGRTRLEQSLSGLSAIAGSANLPHVVFIHDPVAGVSYAMNADTKSATRTPMPQRMMRGGSGGGNGQMRGQAMMGRGRGMFGGRGANAQNVKTESLGRQTIEGVAADGTRTTLTIPAGQMGNEEPIQIVNERWYSQDLQAVVLSKRSDPRTGETVTRLSNVNRSEPSPTLFQVPVDYKVTDNTRSRPASGANKQ